MGPMRRMGLMIGLLAAGLLVLTGCAPKKGENESVAEYRERLDAAGDYAAQWGLEVDARTYGTWGDGHVSGFSYNFSGTHGAWDIRVSGKPEFTGPPPQAAPQPAPTPPE